MDRHHRRAQDGALGVAVLLQLVLTDKEGPHCHGAGDGGQDRRDRRGRTAAVTAGVAQRQAPGNRQERPEPAHRPDQGRRHRHQPQLRDDRADQDHQHRAGAGALQRQQCAGDERDQAEQRDQAPGGDDRPGPAGQCGHHVLAGGGPSRQQRSQHGGADPDHGDRGELPGHDLERSGDPVVEPAEDRQARPGQGDATDSPQHATGCAEHEPAAEHGAAYIPALGPGRGQQRELAPGAFGPDGERRASQQDDLQQRHPDDQRDGRDGFDVVAAVVDRFRRRPGNGPVGGPDVDAKGVRGLHLRPHQLAGDVDQQPNAAAIERVGGSQRRQGPRVEQHGTSPPLRAVLDQADDGKGRAGAIQLHGVAHPHRQPVGQGGGQGEFGWSVRGAARDLAIQAGGDRIVVRQFLQRHRHGRVAARRNHPRPRGVEQTARADRQG